jgi:hypothetical protein
MNILNKLLLLLSLSMSPAVNLYAAENTDFDTFQTAEQYLADFDYLIENSYRLSFAFYYDDGYFYYDYSDENYIFYAFPLYYEIELITPSCDGVKYYTNDKYQFFTFEYVNSEIPGSILIDNYVGEEVEFSFLALDYIGMNQVIEHDQEIESNSISIYNSFYNFFTGFFPSDVVAEYQGIFTFIVVGFLLFLVFGFVFFLFRVIRRLVGFK